MMSPRSSARTSCGAPGSRALRRAALLALTTADAAPIGARSTRRILLLHGTGASAAAFVNHGAKPLISAVPCWLDAGAPGVPLNWQFSALDADEGLPLRGAGYDGELWGYPKGEDEDTATKCPGADESIAAVEANVVEDGIAGIVGFEQGGALAAIVAARSALGDGPPLQFAVCIAAAAPRPFAPLFQRLRDTPSASIPTMHCVSEADANHRAGVALADAFGPTAQLVWHENGRKMPPREFFRDVVAPFLDAAWDGKV